jgi:cytochrome d ubiquinol oxidase subunit II
VSPVGRQRWHDPGIFAILLAFATPAVAAIGVILRALQRGRSSLPFAATVVLFLAALGGLAVSVYPNLVPGRLSIADAVASDGTLVFMLFGIGALVSVMLGYNAYQYVVFRGKIAPPGAA